MSCEEDCWDDPVMERFFLGLEMERVWQKGHTNYSEGIHEVTRYIANFFNTVRLYPKLRYLLPKEGLQNSKSGVLLA